MIHSELLNKKGKKWEVRFDESDSMYAYISNGIATFFPTFISLVERIYFNRGAEYFRLPEDKIEWLYSHPTHNYYELKTQAYINGFN